MFWYSILLLPTVTYASYKVFQTRNRGAKVCMRTVIDVRDSHDAERLIRHVSHENDSVDLVIERLTLIYRTFLPDEKLMRILSILQQIHQGAGNKEDFAATTIYAVASIALQEAHAERRVTSLRSQSWPRRKHVKRTKITPY